MDFGLLLKIVNDINLGLDGQIVPLIIIGLSLLIVTRNTKYIMLLGWSMALGWRRVGLDISFIILLATVIIWVVTLVGSHIIGNTLKSGSEATQNYRIARQKVREGEQKSMMKRIANDLKYFGRKKPSAVQKSLDEGYEILRELEK